MASFMRSVYSDSDIRSSIGEAVLDSHEVPSHKVLDTELGVALNSHTLAAWARGATEGVSFLVENIFHTPPSDQTDEPHDQWSARRVREHLNDLNSEIAHAVAELHAIETRAKK